ncbi:MAG: hypothetical protein IT184_14205 [Acidobacteria bacterium]|nr:hypothetical protein [Acidobacteriota bacterium]
MPFYRAVLRTLKAEGLPFLVGGTYAMAHHTQIHRATKDLDLMVMREDWPAVARALRRAGIYTRLPFPHWLGKAISGSGLVDIIFSSGNGLVPVEHGWLERAVDARVLGFRVLVCPPEELLWSKAFIMERERFDGADVLHLVLRAGRSFDWPHLVRRFAGHERVLLAHLLLFGYVYPGEAAIVPAWVLRQLAAAPIETAPPGLRLCRGTLLSRAQYLVDVERWGFIDPRVEPLGRMSRREQAIWTNAIQQHWSRRARPAV